MQVPTRWQRQPELAHRTRSSVVVAALHRWQVASSCVYSWSQQQQSTCLHNHQCATYDPRGLPGSCGVGQQLPKASPTKPGPAGCVPGQAHLCPLAEQSWSPRGRRPHPESWGHRTRVFWGSSILEAVALHSPRATSGGTCALIL